MTAPIRELYTYEDDLVQAYYENCDPERLMNYGALPQWAVREIYRWYKENEIIPDDSDVFEIVDGFEVIDADALHRLNGRVNITVALVASHEDKLLVNMG